MEILRIIKNYEEFIRIPKNHYELIRIITQNSVKKNENSLNISKNNKDCIPVRVKRS